MRNGSGEGGVTMAKYITLEMIQRRIENIRRNINDRQGNLSREVGLNLNGQYFELTKDNFHINNDGEIEFSV